MHKDIPISGELTPLAASSTTEVTSVEREPGQKKFVVKITQSHLVRGLDEDDKDFYNRRYQEACDCIKSAREEEAAVIEFISQKVPEIKMPKEEWFIFAADDGSPLSGRIQEEIEGTRLKDFGLENLNNQQVDILKRLLQANVECYKQKGRNLDIYGSSTDEERYFKVRQLVFGMLRHSVNLLVADDGNIALVDLRFANMGKSKEAVKYIRTKADLAYLEGLSKRIINRPQ